MSATKKPSVEDSRRLYGEMAYRKKSLPVGVISCSKQQFEANSIALTLLLLFSKNVGEVKSADGEDGRVAGNVLCHHLKLY